MATEGIKTKHGPANQESEQSTGTAPELVPARMLNEYAYCPRLAYLEWVQGEFADSDDTAEGRFQHRRVDRPSGKLDRSHLPSWNMTIRSGATLLRSSSLLTVSRGRPHFYIKIRRKRPEIAVSIAERRWLH